jgi:hypothetical protein
MAAPKTKMTNSSVSSFLNTIQYEERKKDCMAVCSIMQQATGAAPKMWGSSIIGFGNYTYKNKTGKSTDWFITGFSPRKKSLTLYIMPGIDYYKELVKKLGKYKTSVSCLYINKLADIDTRVLKELVTAACKKMKEQI